MAKEESFPGETLVVRGGKPSSGSKLRGGCRLHPDGYFGFSVQAEPGLSVEKLGRALPHKSLGVTTVEEIRRMGYDVIRTSGNGFHATVVVPDDWNVEDADRLARIFREANNPSPGRTS